MKKIIYKPLFLLLLIFLTACAEKIDKNKFKELHQLSNEISSATSIGVNYNDFSKLVISYNAKLSSLKGSEFNEKEKELYDYYSDIYSTYSDSLFLWSLKMDSKEPSWYKYRESFEPNYYKFKFSEIRFYKNKADVILVKYNIEKISKGNDSDTYAIPNNSVSSIWQHVNNVLEKSNKIYNSK